ncbi:MAG: YeeE/YedE family protein [Candidatus Limnocylindria bacterium]
MLVAAAALAVPMAQQEGILAALWALGLAAGLTLQRSRFCFASAFRDLFLFGSARIMKAILLGLAVATTGFAAIMHAAVPFPGFGALPPEAHVLPVGLSTVLGGLLFGYGMVLSGGCVSGSLYRAAEGYVGSWVALAGVVVGLGFVSQTWNWWWTTIVSAESGVWLPATAGLGYTGALGLTFAALLATFVFLLWWEARAGVYAAPSGPATPVRPGFRAQLVRAWDAVFVRGWPAAVGGAALGGIVVVMYAVHMPWGVTGELTRLANASMAAVGAAPPAPLGLAEIGGCAARAEETGLFAHTFSVTAGVLPGALVGALFAKEFKLRFPRSGVRYAQSFGGGALMGVGAGLAIGCTIGAFFSSIASLSLSGWLFAAALAGGAYLGVQTIRRIA